MNGRAQASASQPEKTDQSAQGPIRLLASSGRAKAEPPGAQNSKSLSNPAGALAAARIGGQAHGSCPTGSATDKSGTCRRTGQVQALSAWYQPIYTGPLPKYRSRPSHQNWRHTLQGMSAPAHRLLPRHNARSLAAIRPTGESKVVKTDDAYCDRHSSDFFPCVKLPTRPRAGPK